MSRQIAQPSAHYELAPDEALALGDQGSTESRPTWFVVPPRAQKRKEATRDSPASGLDEFGRLFRARSLVDDGHQRASHAGRVGVLDDVAAINDAGGALLDECFSAFQNFFVG